MLQTMLFLCMLGLFPATGQAQTPTAAPRTWTGFQELQSMAPRSRDLTVEFEQTTFSALRNRNTIQKGRLEFKPPRSFRWEVGQDKKEIYVSDGNEFWKYSELAKHAQRLGADVGELRFLDVFLNPASLSRDYTIREWVGQSATGEKEVTENPPAPQPGKIFASLTPKTKGKLRIIHVVLNKTQGLVEEIRLFFDNGNKSRIAFGVPTEKALPAERFRFTPPPGTAVNK